MAGELTVDAAQALEALKGILLGLGIDYVIGGSVASSYYGEPRSTRDTDLLVRLPAHRLDEFLRALSGRFYAPEQSARDAVRVGGMFNIVHLATMHKFDLYPSRDTTLDEEDFARRRLVPLSPDGTNSSFLGAPEIVVLRKLDWYRRGNLASEHQWRDVLGVLKGQKERLDLDYLRRMAAALEVGELLEQALQESTRPA